MKLDCEPVPLLIGFVLGPLLEEHLRRAMLLSHGDPTTFVTSPISTAFLILAVLMLVLVSFPSIGKRREEIFEED